MQVWYDENNVIRKSIHYDHSDYSKSMECYYDNKGELYNEEDFAYILYNERGNIEENKYFLNGNELTFENWIFLLTF